MIETIEYLFITIGPIVCLVCLLANILNTYIFRSIEFRKTTAFRLLYINSVIAVFLLHVGLFIPFSQCKKVCNVSPGHLIILVYEYYLCLCIGSFFIFVHGGISLLLSIYRFVSIVYVKPKLTFNIKLHLSIVVIICLIVHFPWFVYKEIVHETELTSSFNLSYKYRIQISRFAENKNFQMLLMVAPSILAISVVLKIILDTYTLVHLRSSKVNHRQMGKLTCKEAQDLINYNKSLCNKNTYSRDMRNNHAKETEQTELMNDINSSREINLFKMVFILSIRSLAENLVSLIPLYYFYIYNEDMNDFKITTLTIHGVLSLIFLPNTFIYYNYNDSFRKKFNRFFSCIFSVVKCKCKIVTRSNENLS